MPIGIEVMMTRDRGSTSKTDGLVRNRLEKEENQDDMVIVAKKMG